ncbi:tRNA-dihydrouridine(16/17) synthase [NAD(P)(+)]-like isoform X2 [Phlebotomus argentipes]|uniref:tRNA-dihydrouridine(16/17) synthase [NAD(P)(+)]-like isoform X2 n=1 Tax=Phlebotomus argentipes TaxID=94469 RepID=UPI0028931773|nr:tRNA-dihydrouridine(16/17) synthase [NAD(P)(+)]-like isoform X2 [Phlebotomus argentipes]
MTKDEPTQVDFYRDVLGSPKFVVAPMVDQSELAWRMLSRRHGAHLCYTPMIHSSLFVKDPKYRKDAIQTCAEDRPLIVQFCGNDPQTLLEAGLIVQDLCDCAAVDINLGCPQAIARKGHYGAFLQDEWDLISDIVNTLSKNLRIPVTCKIRIFEDIQKTILYAQMLERSGCKLLTVHGRTREQKGPLTGLADWRYVKTIREHIKIPIFSNGNIQCLEDVTRCLEETGVQGIMTAEGNLYNPSVFESKIPLTWEICKEYLDLVELYPCPSSFIRGHLFKILHHLLALPSNDGFRSRTATAQNIEDFRRVVNELEAKYLPIHEGVVEYVQELSSTDEPEKTFNISIPPWLCHSYIRIPPEEHKMKLEEAQKRAEDPNREKRLFYDEEGNQISRKKMKKLRRLNRKPGRQGSQNERSFDLCAECTNPVGLKCSFSMCKRCCKSHCLEKDVKCIGHKLLKNE